MEAILIVPNVLDSSPKESPEDRVILCDGEVSEEFKNQCISVLEGCSSSWTAEQETRSEENLAELDEKIGALVEKRQRLIDIGAESISFAPLLSFLHNVLHETHKEIPKYLIDFLKESFMRGKFREFLSKKRNPREFVSEKFRRLNRSFQDLRDPEGAAQKKKKKLENKIVSQAKLLGLDFVAPLVSENDIEIDQSYGQIQWKSGCMVFKAITDDGHGGIDPGEISSSSSSSPNRLLIRQFIIFLNFFSFLLICFKLLFSQGCRDHRSSDHSSSKR